MYLKYESLTNHAKINVRYKKVDSHVTKDKDTNSKLYTGILNVKCSYERIKALRTIINKGIILLFFK